MDADADDESPDIEVEPTSGFDNFYVWITALGDSHTEQIVGRLVRRNWHVLALGNQLSLHAQDNNASLIALGVSKPWKDEHVAVAAVLEDVKDVLKVLKVHHYSVIVTQLTGCTWCLGNVTQTELDKLAAERKKATN